MRNKLFYDSHTCLTFIIFSKFNKCNVKCNKEAHCVRMQHMENNGKAHNYDDFSASLEKYFNSISASV